MKALYIVLTDTWSSFKAPAANPLDDESETVKAKENMICNQEEIRKKFDIDPIFTASEVELLEKKYKVYWLIFAKNQEDAILQETLASSLLKVSKCHIFLHEKGSFLVKENPKDIFFVANDFNNVLSTLKLEWSEIDKTTQFVFVSNSLGGSSRKKIADKNFFELQTQTKAKIYSLYQLDAKIEFLQVLQSNPEIWNSENVIKVGGVFSSKKFFKLIKKAGLFIDKPPFFYSAIDPINELDFDFNIILYKLSDPEEIEKFIASKKELERQNKPVLFPNPPELISCFRDRALNIHLMQKVIDNPVFKGKFESFCESHPELKGKKFLVPPTVTISPSEARQEVGSSNQIIEMKLKEAGISETILIKGQDGSNHQLALVRDLSRAEELIATYFVSWFKEEK